MKRKYLILVLAVLFIISTFWVLFERQRLRDGTVLNAELQELIKQEETEKQEIEPPEPTSIALADNESDLEEEKPIQDSGEPKILDKYAELYSRNPDMVGYISNGDILDYPIMQSIGDSDFYLDHDFDRNESMSGSLFIQNNVVLDIKPGICMIHGHNLKNDTMFGALDKYMDKEYLAENSTLQIDTLFEKQTYEVLGVFLQQVFPEDYEGFKYYDYIGDVSEDEFNEYKSGITKLMRSGDVSSLEYGDKVIELSTCYYHVNNGRLVQSRGWCLHRSGNRVQVSSTVGDNSCKCTVLFHKELFKLYHGRDYQGDIDHISMVEVDNTDENLNAVTNSQNKMNKFTRGYFYDKSECRFRSRLKLNGRVYHPYSVVHREDEACIQQYYIEQVTLHELMNDFYYQFDFLKYRRGSEDILDLERTGRISEEEATYRHVLRYAGNAWYYLRFGLQDFFRDYHISVPEYSLDSNGFMVHPITGQKLCTLYK